MDAQQELKARWEDAQGRIKEAWGALTNDDILKSQGNWEQLVATIRAKTGESVGAVEDRLNAIIDTIKTKAAPKESGDESSQ